MFRPASLLRHVASVLAVSASLVAAAERAPVVPAAQKVQTATKSEAPRAVAGRVAKRPSKKRARPKGSVAAKVVGKRATPHGAPARPLHVAKLEVQRNPRGLAALASVATVPVARTVAIVDATPLRFLPPAAAAEAPGGLERGRAPATPGTAARGSAEAAVPKEGALAKGQGKGRTADRKTKKSKRDAPKPPCLRAAVHFERFDEKGEFSLLTCEGSPAPFAQERLSVVARPGGIAVPSEAVEVLAARKGELVAPGVRRLDAGLLERLQAVVERLRPNATATVSVVSGYRPASKGSLHAEGQAIDFSLAGASNIELVEACKVLDDTGCGFYPNSSFIHLDVRPKGAGHVSWIDASGPGEEARYVAAWPLSPNDARRARVTHGVDLPDRQGREWHTAPTDERRGVAAATAAPIAMPDEPSDR